MTAHWCKNAYNSISFMSKRNLKLISYIKKTHTQVHQLKKLTFIRHEHYHFGIGENL